MNKFVENVLQLFMNQNQNAPLTQTQQSYIDILKSGNASAGEQLAMNLCNTMGISKDQAIAEARQYFGL